MIRFVDLRYQGIGYRFAFWDTVTDTFISIDDSQAWDTFEEFESEYMTYHNAIDRQILDRYKSLCPKWTFHQPTNEEEMYGFRRLGFFAKYKGR